MNTSLDRAYRGVSPVRTSGLIIVRVHRRGREEVSPLGDILLSFLPSDLDLLLLAAAAKVVGLEASLVFVF